MATISKDKLQKELEDFHEKFNEKVQNYFLQEIKKISDEYNVWIENYGILRMSDKTTGETLHEGDFKHWDEVQSKIWKLTLYDIVRDLEYRYQAYEYSEEHKFFQ